MIKLSVFLYTLALGSAFYSCSTAKQDTPQTDYTQYVDPFIEQPTTDIPFREPAVLSV